LDEKNQHLVSSINVLIDALLAKYPINKVFLSASRDDKKGHVVKKLCRQNKVYLQLVPQQVINRKLGSKNQGVFAELSPVTFFSLSEIVKKITKGLILVLSGINDTGNLGAIIRTAAGAGVDGILISQKNSAPINETVLKTSVGALFHTKIARSPNLSRDLDTLKKSDFWVIGADMAAETPYYDWNFDCNIALVMGNETKGLGPLIKKKVDAMVSIPLAPEVDSLNVSVATGVILYEILRQKGLNQR
jgi:23S rRNA (guanosine2251-2'-O)-methyltransferase